MPCFLFVWDSETEDHLLQNGVTAEEFEDVVCNPDSVGESRSSGRPIAFGYSQSGKYLACVYEMIDPDTVLPITGYEVED